MKTTKLQTLFDISLYNCHLPQLYPRVDDRVLRKNGWNKVTPQQLSDLQDCCDVDIDTSSNLYRGWSIILAAPNDELVGIELVDPNGDYWINSIEETQPQLPRMDYETCTLWACMIIDEAWKVPPIS